MVLTKSELEIMDVLWDAEVPLSRSNLLERSEEKNWKDSSVHILLNGLLQKNAIECVGYVRRCKTYGRVFKPMLTREQYYAGLIFAFPHKPDMIGVFRELLSRPEMTPEALARIEALVSTAEK